MDIIINDRKNNPPEASKPLTTQGDYLINFLVSLGYDPMTPPLGDLLAHYHQLSGRWLAVAPIYWEASHNDAMIAAVGDDLEMTDADSRSLFHDVEAFLAEPGLPLYYHDKHTWLIRVDDKPEIKSKPVHVMRRLPMMPELHNMDSSLYWQGMLTELQMYLSSHPRNQQRSYPWPVNGLWIYGEGKLMPDLWCSKASPKARILTDDNQWVSCFPNQISLLSSETPLTRDALLLINDGKNHYEKLDQVNKSHQSVRWFWNDIAYSTAASGWWKTLWRR
jgi:hypothetical protein